MVMVGRDIKSLTKKIIEQFSGNCALAFYDFQSGMSYDFNATTIMHSASIIKLPILLATLKEVERENLSLTSKHRLVKEVQVSGAGVLHELQPESELTLHDLLKLMVIISDNTATNMVIDIVGIETVNSFCRDLKLGGTELIGKLQLEEDELNIRQRTGECNHATPQDILQLLNALVEGELISQELSSLAIDFLKAQQSIYGISRYLPIDEELYSDHIEVASKDGSLRGLSHDAGIVFRNGVPMYSLVIMTNHSTDRKYHVDQEGLLLIARVSQVIFESYAFRESSTSRS